MSNVKKIWLELPSLVRVFLMRSLVIFFVWKLSYHLYLKPHRILDKPLTHLVAKQTSFVLSKLYSNYTFRTISYIPNNNVDFYYELILKDSAKCIAIVDPCNALELIILNIGFLLAIPLKERKIKLILFLIAGTLLIHFFNVLRCSAIAYLNIEKSWSTEVAHHYIFKTLMYVLIFAGWMLFVKDEKITNVETK